MLCVCGRAGALAALGEFTQRPPRSVVSLQRGSKSLFRPRGGPLKPFLKVSFKEALKNCKLKFKDRLN